MPLRVGAFIPLLTVEQLIDQLERFKASIWAKVEHLFRVKKRQYGHVKMRYRGLKKTLRNCTRCLRCPTREWQDAA